MVEVREVRTPRERKEFIDFPLKLYKGCQYFVPPLYMDERNLFGSKNIYNDCCDAVYYNAYRDGKIVGRIMGVIQRACNEKNNEKRVRFGRFDSIDDQEVADALFSAVEQWAMAKGMDTMHGPLGFSDLEREGLLIDGFDQLSTFEEQYSYPYYQKLIENRGFVKEVDWNESRLYLPDNADEELADLDKLAKFVMKRYKLRIGEARNVDDFIKRYADGLFELIDKSYDLLYGTVPFTPAMKKQMIDSFRFIVDLRYVAVILDENDRMVCFGICFPNISDAVRASNGRISPRMLMKFFKAKRNPRVIDLGLVGVDPEYLNRGISVIITAELMRMLRSGGIKYAETNSNLEDNYSIQNQWKRFKRVIHKRRRAYVKKLV